MNRATPPTIKKKALINEVEFETKFYQHLVGTEDYELIFLNDSQFKLTDEQLAEVEAASEVEGFGVVYVVEHKNHITFFTKDNSKIGLMPKHKLKAFTS